MYFLHDMDARLGGAAAKVLAASPLTKALAALGTPCAVDVAAPIAPGVPSLASAAAALAAMPVVEGAPHGD